MRVMEEREWKGEVGRDDLVRLMVGEEKGREAGIKREKRRNEERRRGQRLNGGEPERSRGKEIQGAGGKGWRVTLEELEIQHSTRGMTRVGELLRNEPISEVERKGGRACGQGGGGGGDTGAVVKDHKTEDLHRPPGYGQLGTRQPGSSSVCCLPSSSSSSSQVSRDPRCPPQDQTSPASPLP